MKIYLYKRQVLVFLFILTAVNLWPQTFTDSGIPLTGVSESSVAWGDYDNDGDLDILLTGYAGSSNYFSKIYRSEAGTFTDINAGLTGVYSGSTAWGDFDNDGDLDILLTGFTGASYVSKIYRNDAGVYTDINAGLTGVSSSSVAWGDSDNDGDLDILLTGYTGSTSISRIYINNGNNSFSEQTGISLTGVSSGSCAWGDYDNDGDLDILLTGNSSSNPVSKIYRNDTGVFTDIDAGLKGVGYGSSAAWGDYDNDGYLDILLTGYSGTYISKIYRNNGNDTFSEKTGISLTGVIYSSAAWGDYDNDGYLDIILTGYSGTYISKIYRNNGNDTFSEQTDISLTGINRGSVAWGDYENDGDIDILLSGQISSGTYITKIYLNNIGVINTKPSIPVNLQSLINEGIVTLTWDRSTDNQTPQTGLSYNLYVYESGQSSYRCSPHAFRQSDVLNGKRLIARIGNIQWNADGYILKDLPPDKTYYWTVQAIDGGLLGSNFAVEQSFIMPFYRPITQANCINYSYQDNQLTLTWVNGGGSKRAVFLKEGSTGTADPVDNTTYSINDSTPGGWKCVYNGIDITTTITGIIPCYDYSVHVCEYNGLSGNEKYLTKEIVQNPARINTCFTEQTGIPLPIAANNLVAWGDYNNDDYLDFLLSNYGYKNNTDNTFTQQLCIIECSVSPYSIDWGDYDNDSDLDILLTGSDIVNDQPVSRIFKNNSNETFSEQTGIALEGVRGNAKWGDYDSDGDLDILLTGYNSSDYLVSKIYRNEVADNFIEQAAIVLTVFGGSTDWGDYDNDGDLDILLTGQSYSGNHVSAIYKNNGDNSFNEQTDISLQGVSRSSAAWGDYDSDGDLDIVLTGYNNSYQIVTKIYRNDGNNIFIDQVGILLTGVHSSKVAWGDYDNDGDLDILIAGATASYPKYDPVTKIYRNDGNNIFTEQKNILLTGISFGTSAWGDYDNDGDLDIILCGKDANDKNISKIYKNNCVFINEIPGQPDNLHYEINNKNTLLRWNSIKDDETSPKSITYNVRIGNKSGACNFISPQSSSTGFRLKVDMGNAQMDTTFIFKDLRWDTTYYASVQAVDNSFKGGAFSNEVQFRIDPSQPTNLIATYINNNSLLLRWKRGNGDRCIVFAMEGTSGIANPQNYITYYSNPIFAEGSTLDATGWYCIYKGEADSVLLSGLSPAKNYIIHAIEFQGNNGSEIYAPTLTSENIGIFSPTLFSEQTGIALEGVRGNANWGDYDNDGDLDILLTGIDDSWNRYSLIYQNNGDNTFYERTDISLPGVTGSSVAWGDYDNDSDLDILLTGDSDDGYISQIYRNNGDNSFTEQTHLGLMGVFDGSVVWGDYDNDGDLDILLTGQDSGLSNISRIYNNNGGNSFTEQSDIGLTGVSGGSADWGDYDNDGDLDILLIGYNSDNDWTPVSKIFCNNGDNIFTEKAGINLAYMEDGSGIWSDYDNDGALDILLTGIDSSYSMISKIYHNNGNETFTEKIEINLPGVGYSAVANGDYDNDGALDILLTGIDSSYSKISKIYRNNGDNIFTEQTGTSISEVESGSVAWGDYDNDGDLDILLTGSSYSGPVSKIYRNNLVMKAGTIKPNTMPNAPTGLSSTITPGNIKLSWFPVTNDETPADAMSYNLRYKLKDSINWKHAPQSADDGFRRLPTMGNIQLNKNYNLSKLPPGTYYWQVQAVDQGYMGGKWSAVDSFVVKNIQAFFKTDTVCQSLATTFTDQSVATDGIASWRWDFKDGTTSLIQSPIHTYSESGTFNVKLVITSTAGDKDSLEQNVIVKARPITSFEAPAVCEGTSTSITNSTNVNGLTIDSWYWDFGDEQTSSSQDPASHTYSLKGTYQTLLKAAATNGCADSTTKEVIVAAIPNASVSINGKTTFCQGDSVLLNVEYNPDYTYQWKLDNNDLTSTDSSLYKVKFYSGAYSVKVTNTLANCISTSSQTSVTVNQVPVSPYISTGGLTTFCDGDSVVLSVTNTAGDTYQWKQNGGAVGSDKNSFTAKSSGTYSLTVSNSSGCSADATNTVVVTVNPKPSIPTVNVDGSKSFCQGGSVDLSVTNNTAYTYQWQNSGSNITGATTNSYKAQNSGIYSLTIKNSEGCESKTESITVNSLTTPVAPTISTTGVLQFCQGDSVVLSVTDNPDYSYQWKQNDGAVGSDTSQFVANASGTYNLVVSNANGCSVTSTNSIDVTVNPVPVVNNISLSGPATFCQGGSVTLSVPSTVGYTYSWRNEYGLIAGANTNSYTTNTSGTYQLDISNSSNCSVRTSAVSVTVKPTPYKPILGSVNYEEGKCPGENIIRLSPGQTFTDYRYQWYKDGLPLLNDTLSRLDLIDAGKYKLEANLGGCKSESDVFNIVFPEVPDKPMIYVRGPEIWYLACSNTTAAKYKWYCNNKFIEGADKYYYVANRRMGDYQVSIGNDKGCYTKSDIFTIPTGITGIEDIDLFESLRIYPNPSRGLFTIEMDNELFGELLIGIITEQGKDILSLKFEKTNEHFSGQVDLSNQAKGLYFINLAIEKSFVTKKLVVK